MASMFSTSNGMLTHGPVASLQLAFHDEYNRVVRDADSHRDLNRGCRSWHLQTAGSVSDPAPVDLGHLDGRKTHGVLSGTEFRQLGHVSPCAAVLEDSEG